ncbi:MAG: hypothetical protein ACT4P3_08210 [Betaproteobacteria bacterium]
MRKTCRICGGAMALETIDASGTDGTVKVSVRGMPAGKCPRGHAEPAEDEFMLWLMRELKERAAGLPAGAESGMLVFKKYRCDCGKELAAKPERSQAFPFDLAYEGLPAFKAEMEVPLYKCTGCGKELARSHDSIRSHTSHAVARVHDAAGFPHYG